jgi:glucose/mannose-6-phosphate isomerase
MARTVSDGPARMRALAASLPTGLLEGYRAGRELALPTDGRTTRVYAVGMGGSGIAADLARGVVDAESSASFTVVRAPELPRSIDPKSKVVLVSYSGNTWETLRSYETAGRAGAARVVITSGGALAERAAADDVPILPVPPGMPPRSAVGHLLGGVLGLLDPLFPESNESRIARIAERTRTLIGGYSRARGPAAQLAQSLGDRFPFVYAESSFLALARRWKTQIEENAKRIAAFDEVPELFHNALVGWDAIGVREASRHAVVLLEWSGEDATTRKSLRYLEKLLGERDVLVLRALLAPEDRLEALIGGIALGDLVSLFLADRRRVDPYPVEAITRLKAAIGTPAPRSK